METVTIQDFQKLDIRIGTVVEAEVPKWNHWVIKLTVDLGKEIGKKTIFAGIMKFYKPEDLIKKQVPVVVNLEPKRIGPEGDTSEGMVLMAVEKEDEETPPTLLTVDKKVPNGTKIR